MAPDARAQQRLTAALDGFDSWSVARGAGALALWPPNADRIAAIATIGRSLPVPATAEDELPDLSATGWRAWLASSASDAARSIVPDGVYDAPPVVQSALFGERFALLAGFLPDADLHMRLWTDALAETLLMHGDDKSIRDALRVLAAACTLSDIVVEKSGIADDGIWPDHHLMGAISVPDDACFLRLSRALELTPGELHGLEHGAEILDALVADAAAADGRCRLFPLIRRETDKTLLLRSPNDLLQAALVHAGQLVAASGLACQFCDALRSQAMRVISLLAADMDCVVEQVCTTGAVIRFDVDKSLAIELTLQPPAIEADPALYQTVTCEAALDRLAALHAADPTVVLGIVAHLGDGRPTSWKMPDPCSPFGPWPTSLAGWRLIADGLRRDQLGLWRQLQHVPLPPWPPGIELTDIVGLSRHLEDHPPPIADDSAMLDGTEYLHQRARFMAARHPAPTAPDRRMVSVSRWRGTSDQRLFVEEKEADDGALLVRAPGRFVWVVPEYPHREIGSLEETLVTMTAFWCARLLENGWLYVPDGGELAVRIAVHFDDRTGPALAVTPATAGARFVAGPAFVHALARGDNLADRWLVLALAHTWLGLPAQRLMKLVDTVCPAGYATFTVWPQPDARRQDRGPEAPPLVPEGLRKWIGVELASHLVEPEQIAVIQAEALQPCLDRLVGILVGIIDRRCDELAPEAVRAAVDLHERALVQEEREGITLPARDAMPSGDDILGTPEADARRGLALRALVDRLAARPPSGVAPASLERMIALRAYLETLVQWGSMRDAVHAGTASGRMIVSSMHGIVMEPAGPAVTAGAAQLGQHAAAAPERMLDAHSGWWTEEPDPDPIVQLDRPIELEDELWRHVDETMLQTWGFRWQEMLRILRLLSDRALACPQFSDSCGQDELARYVATRTRIAPDRVASALGELRLDACPDYDVRQREHKPWGVNRERSYVRRPLVVLPSAHIAWSAEHVLRTARFLSNLCITNRLVCTGSLRLAVGKLSQRADREFEGEVARRARDSGWSTLESRKSLGGRRLERARGQAIGNLDVVAFDAELGRVWLLEAKRLFPSLMPLGLENERTELAVYVAKHVERLKWVRTNIDRLETEVGKPRSGEAWRINAALVVDHPMAGAHVAAFDLSIWTIDALRCHLGT